MTVPTSVIVFKFSIHGHCVNVEFNSHQMTIIHINIFNKFTNTLVSNIVNDEQSADRNQPDGVININDRVVKCMPSVDKNNDDTVL